MLVVGQLLPPCGPAYSIRLFVHNNTWPFLIPPTPTEDQQSTSFDQIRDLGKEVVDSSLTCQSTCVLLLTILLFHVKGCECVNEVGDE